MAEMERDPAAKTSMEGKSGETTTAAAASAGMVPSSLHNRNVSWEDSNSNINNTATRLQQPVLETTTPLTIPVPTSPESNAVLSDFSMESTTLPHFSSSSPNNLSLEEKITLTEMRKHPMESEAENYVLSAIEDMDQRRNSSVNEQQQVLPGVPDIAMHVFQTESTDGVKSTNHSRAHSNASFVSANNNSHATNSKRSTNHRPKMISRNATIEQTLSSLTEAMADLHGRKTDKIQVQADMILMDDPNAGSADTFGKAANIIFRGNKTDASSSPNKPRTARANWRKLQTTMQVSSGVGSTRGSETMIDGIMPASTIFPPKADPKANWSKLRMSVMATGAASATIKNKKKNDDDEDGDPELGNIQEEKSSQFEYSDDDEEDDENYDDPRLSKRQNKLMTVVKDSVVGDFDTFVRQRRNAVQHYVKFLILIVIPAIGLACILFYLAGNPPTGIVDRAASTSNSIVNTDGNAVDLDQASYSYWILFFVRQVFTFTLARALQVFIIDFLCLSTKTTVNLVGNMVTLLIIQSRGWPFMLIFWGLLDFGLLQGSSRFVDHWLYWQDALTIFNEENPSGEIPASDWNRRILLVAICVGAVVSLKRLWLGLYLGRKTYTNYAEDLAKVMKKVVLLCEVAVLARDLENNFDMLPGKRAGLPSVEDFGMTREEFDDIVQENDESIVSPSVIPAGEINEDSNRSLLRSRTARNVFVIDPSDYKSSGLTDIQKSKINELLGAWEDPEKDYGVVENVSIRAILQFRQSLSYLDNNFMFSLAWGDVSTRERCIMSSQKVFKRLLSRTPRKTLLSFDILALIAIMPDNTLDIEKLKELIRLLRPDRDGKLGMLDFVKSVDDAYKEARLLRASVKNSQKIDRAFEKAINVVFYVIMAVVILSQLGYDPLALFLSLSSVILAFAFMIGSASSKMFEGFLFILVRRPYDIGDRIHISSPESDTNVNGSLSWFVRDVDLFTTTVVLAATGEKATLSNGSLASSRVINMARSPNASLFITLRFAIDTPLEKIEIFEEAVRKFVKSRPREWAQFLSFRAKDVLQDLGYVEYIACLQHRESWQNIGACLMSKAEVASFCLELSKKLDMRYRSPPLPVDLSIVNKDVSETESVVAKFQALSSTAGDDVAKMFSK